MLSPRAINGGMQKNVIFYDGHCGLCHGWVKFVLRFDKLGIFSFSPLQGETIKKMLSSETINLLPDSVVVIDESAGVHIKARAVELILKKLGGLFSVVSCLLGILPFSFKDWAYDLVAKNRKKIFGEKEEVCPLMPETLRARFLP